MKKIGIDLLYIKNNEVSGVKKLGEELVDGLNKTINNNYQLVLFIDKDMEQYYNEKYPNIKKVTIENRLKTLNIKYISRILRLINKKSYNTIKKEKCDIVLHPYVTFDSPIGKKINSVSSILDFNPIDIMDDKKSLKYKTMNRMYKKMIYKTNYIVTISEYSKKRIFEVAKKYKGRVEVIPSSVQRMFKSNIDIKDILEEEKPYIFSINSFFKYKNQITLLKAFNIIKDKIPHNLVLVGRPELDSGMSGYPEIMEYIGKNNLQDRVKVMSFISDEERNCLFYNTDLFVTTSTQEGFGRTPVEAAMCRVPVISSQDTSLREATLGLVNYYENSRDENELANKILEVLNNKPSNEELDSIAKKLEKEYNEENIARKYMNLIDEILKEK